MNDRAEWNGDESELGNSMKQLLGRYSVGPKHMVGPAPSVEQILTAAAAALRAPDRHNLQPFRFVLIPDERRPLLGELFADFARRNGKSDAEIAIERERALLGPALLAFVVHLEENEQVPPQEQWIAAGGALANFLTALHFMGFGAKVLSGRKTADPVICRAFCEEGESLVGWIAAGTATKEPHPRESDNPGSILRRWNPA
jgi:nitroreductase